MAKTPAARVALAADGAVARRRAEIVEHRPVACVGVPYERFRPVCSTVCLLALTVASFGVGGVLLAPGGRRHRKQSAPRILAHMGVQLDKADAMDTAGKLKGERHKLGVAIHGLTRFRGRVESSRQHPPLDQAVADRLAQAATWCGSPATRRRRRSPARCTSRRTRATTRS